MFVRLLRAMGAPVEYELLLENLFIFTITTFLTVSILDRYISNVILLKEGILLFFPHETSFDTLLSLLSRVRPPNISYIYVTRSKRCDNSELLWQQPPRKSFSSG